MDSRRVMECYHCGTLNGLANPCCGEEVECTCDDKTEGNCRQCKAVMTRCTCTCVQCKHTRSSCSCKCHCDESYKYTFLFDSVDIDAVK